MHELLRILLNDLPATSEGFAGDRMERWLDAWAATVRYVYAEPPAGDLGSVADTAATDVLGPSELDRPSSWGRTGRAGADTRAIAPGPGGTDAPLQVRGGGSPSSMAPHSGLEPSTQPWYAFGADSGDALAGRGQRDRAAGGPPPGSPPPSLPRATSPPSRVRAWTVEDDARLVQGYRAGATPEQLAGHFGRSASAVRERLMQLGMERR
jgi:hypothetical protein